MSPKKVEEIKDALLNDPSFEPQEGRTREESAWAVAWSRYKQMKNNEKALTKLDLLKMWLGEIRK